MEQPFQQSRLPIKAQATFIATAVRALPLLCLSMTPWLFALFLAVAAASDPAVHIYHRVRLPGEPAPFTPKGTVLLAPTGPSYAPAAAFRQDIAAWSKSSSPGARYEVALQTDGDPEDWPRSSVKLVRAHSDSRPSTHRFQCHVTGAPEEFITVHKTTAGDIFALDYLLPSVPRDGTCPTKPALLYLASADVQLKSPTPAFA